MNMRKALTIVLTAGLVLAISGALQEANADIIYANDFSSAPTGVNIGGNSASINNQDPTGGGAQSYSVAADGVDGHLWTSRDGNSFQYQVADEELRLGVLRSGTKKQRGRSTPTTLVLDSSLLAAGAGSVSFDLMSWGGATSFNVRVYSALAGDDPNGPPPANNADSYTTPMLLGRNAAGYITPNGTASVSLLSQLQIANGVTGTQLINFDHVADHDLVMVFTPRYTSKAHEKTVDIDNLVVNGVGVVTGPEPAITGDPDPASGPIDLGEVYYGGSTLTSGETDLTVTSAGDADLELYGFTGWANGFSLATGHDGSVTTNILAPEATEAFTFQFDPTGLGVGDYFADITLLDNALGDDLTYRLEAEILRLTVTSDASDYWDLAATWNPAFVPTDLTVTTVSGYDTVTSRTTADTALTLDIGGTSPGTVIVADGAVLSIVESTIVHDTGELTVASGGRIAYWYVKPSSQGGSAAYPPKSLYYDLGEAMTVDEIHLWWQNRDSQTGTTGLPTDMDIDYIALADNGTPRGIKSKMGDLVIPGGKGTMGDTGTHMPFVTNWPSPVPAGKVRDDLIDFSDIMPTLADLGGADLPKGVKIDGRSFALQLRGKAGKPRRWVYIHHGDKRAKPNMRAVRDKRWKVYADGRQYDMKKDPFEKSPLASDAGPDKVAAATREHFRVLLKTFEQVARSL